ncbi:MAG: polysaccharide biosynthesis protein, partial [Chlorobi bacterium]|nr:polysaccharide biosynthesis protein [Chlorobiota bacterium]
VLISLPSRPLRKISSIFLAEAWKKNNIEEVNTVYKKSISTLFLIGTLIYVGIIINLDNIFEIIPKYESGRNVIILIGAAYLVDMLSGTSASIISNSKHYKVLGYIMMATVGLVIITNIIFIPIWQLTGAAFASFITIVIAFFMRFLFLYFKYKLQPYFYKHFLILIIGALMLVVNYFIPENNNFILDIIIRSSVITVLFISLSYFLKISEDANKLINLILSKFGIVSLK